MDFLKIFRNFNFLLLILLSAGYLKAQDNTGLQNAFKESYSCESKYQYTEAISAINKYYDAKSYEINLRLGWLFYLNKQYDESIKYYQTAINIKPNSIEAKFGLLNPEAAIEDFTKVAIQYEDILKIDPQNTKANYNLGLYYYYRPDYNNAYKYFEKVVNLYPFDYDSNLMYAWTNYQLGKYSESAVNFNIVLLLNPSDASALQGLNLIKGK